MPPKWGTCGNCGQSFAGLSSPYCSQRCSAEAARKRAMGQKTDPPPENIKPTRGPERRGKSTSPGPPPAKKGSLCDCDGDLCLIMKLNMVLALAALLVPKNAGGLVLGALRFYRRWLTRFTPSCPDEVSCSEYAVQAVKLHGPRQGLRMAARKVQECGR